jgi:hypothetical protein
MARKTRKQIKEEMIEEAKKLHGNITPCVGHEDFMTCFTEVDEMLLLWFNDKHHNTKVVARRIEDGI